MTYTEFLLNKLQNKLRIMRNDDVWTVAVLDMSVSHGIGDTLNSALFDLCNKLGIYSDAYSRNGYGPEDVVK
jgi:hypothetical protein